MNVFDYPDEKLLAFAREICGNLRTTVDSIKAIAIIKDALEHFTIFDIQTICSNIRYEVNRLPEPYQKRYRPYSMDIMKIYDEFIQGVRRNNIHPHTILNEKLWMEYWDASSETLFFDVSTPNDPRPGVGKPAGKLFYRLIYGYAMLLAEKPGHPVGMPFPGGWTVKEKNGIILCPIRDKEKDLPQALCNYCPAIQDEDTI